MKWRTWRACSYCYKKLQLESDQGNDSGRVKRRAVQADGSQGIRALICILKSPTRKAGVLEILTMNQKLYRLCLAEHIPDGH